MSKTNALLSGVVVVLVLAAVLSMGGNSKQQTASDQNAIPNRTLTGIAGYGLTCDCTVDGKSGVKYADPQRASGYSCSTSTSCTSAGGTVSSGEISIDPYNPTLGTQASQNIGSTSPFSKSSLSFGLKNDSDVKVAQDMLRMQGVFNFLGPATGNFGSVTMKATEDFQKLNGLTVTGQLDPITIGVLQQSAEAKCAQITNTGNGSHSSEYWVKGDKTGDSCCTYWTDKDGKEQHECGVMKVNGDYWACLDGEGGVIKDRD